MFGWDAGDTGSGSGWWDEPPARPGKRGAKRRPAAVREGPAAEDDEPDEDEAPETLTVPDVAARMSALLSREFPEPFWLVGETSGLERTLRSRGGHWYFSLVDNEGSGAQRASLNAIMWKRTVDGLFGKRGRLARSGFEPGDGVVWRVLVKPDFYAPHGKLNFVIQDVDPSFTLGSLDRERREVLARLEREGAHEWNKAVALADVPLRIGVITSQGSAAHHDVMEGLTNSGLGFEVLFCDARMQGADTTRTVRGAIASLERLAPDVIIVARGGGSRLDLSWFDKEDVARAIASCSVPVLTGIGHEIDTSVADIVAHSSFKTPTGAAEFLVERVSNVALELEGSFERILHLTGVGLDEAQARLLDVCRRTRQAASIWDGRERAVLTDVSTRLRAAARQLVDGEQRRVDRFASRLVTGRHVDALGEHDRRLASIAERLGHVATATLAKHEQRVSLDAERVRLLDPSTVLERGYAYVKRGGEVVKDAVAVRAGQDLTIVFRDGDIDVKAKRGRRAPEPTLWDELEEPPSEESPVGDA